MLEGGETEDREIVRAEFPHPPLRQEFPCRMVIRAVHQLVDDRKQPLSEILHALHRQPEPDLLNPPPHQLKEVRLVFVDGIRNKTEPAFGFLVERVPIQLVHDRHLLTGHDRHVSFTDVRLGLRTYRPSMRQPCP
jgi:hypothetical protein